MEEKLLEQIEEIKQKITDQEYIDMLETLSQSKKKRVSIYNVELLVSKPERDRDRISINTNIDNRIVLMNSDEIDLLTVGLGVSLNDDGSKIFKGEYWDNVDITMDNNNADEYEIRVDYVPLRFLGAEKITDNVE